MEGLEGTRTRTKIGIGNAGMTLIELIVVIAIMGVVTGAMALSTNFVGKSRINKAYELIQSDYSLARSNSMTKAVATDLTITIDGNYYYIQVGQESRSRLISKSTTISFNVSSSVGGSEEPMTFEQMAAEQGSTDTVTLAFSKSSGALKSYDSGSHYISAIFVDTKGIYITYETGKYSTTDYD